MAIIKQFTVKVKEFTRKEDGEKFLAYKAINNKGNLVDLRFTREVPEEDRPVVNSMMGVDLDFMNLQTNTEYPILWVRSVQYHFPLEANKSKLNEMFDDANYEELSNEELDKLDQENQDNTDYPDIEDVEDNKEDSTPF